MNDLGNKEIMAKNIQFYMDKHGKSRLEMCEALGVKYTTFTDWVKAKTYPRIDKIELMANYFGIDKSDLVEDKSKTRKYEKKIDDGVSPLSEIEKTIILKYRSADPISKEMVHRALGIDSSHNLGKLKGIS